MGRSGLKSGLLLSTSVITAALAYSRRAYANCIAVSGPSSAYTCTGAPGGPTTYSFNGSDISVLAEATTVFFNDADFPASNQISISGDGDLTFGSAGSVTCSLAFNLACGSNTP